MLQNWSAVLNVLLPNIYYFIEAIETKKTSEVGKNQRRKKTITIFGFFYILEVTQLILMYF